MKGLAGLIFVFMATIAPLAAFGLAPGDSIGTKVVNGKYFILYRVAKGDNFTQISRDYGTTVTGLEEANQMKSSQLQIGQVILVPATRSVGSASQTESIPGAAAKKEQAPDVVTKKEQAPDVVTKKEHARDVAPKKEQAPDIVAKKDQADRPGTGQSPGSEDSKNARKQHLVQKGETLYAVSRQYSVSVEQIKQWNNLNADGINEGQRLWVGPETASATVSNVEKPVVKDAVEKKPETKPELAKTDNRATEVARDPSRPKTSPGIHVVRQGETLFGIAKTYGMDVSELKRINRLESATITEGQALQVKADSPANSNQGVSLKEMLDDVSFVDHKAADGVSEGFPDMRVLTAPRATVIPSSAEVTVYKDKATGENYRRVEEKGKAGMIQDYSTDQTRFYAFHRYLPVGSYIRVDYPEKGQSILVEVINQLPEKDACLVRLSAKSMEYLMIREQGAPVRLRYVVPFGE